jgi:peptidoglycan/LPS O-acetylase OafA/YrhL
MTESARPLSFTTIQAGRGIAALLVVLYHATVTIADRKYWGEPVLGSLFSFGHAGVPFFFVLSGFIILWIHEKDIGRPERVGRYLWRRAARIYPPYWAVSLFILAVYAALPAIGAAHPVDPMGLIQSLALVGAPQSSILSVGWTLFHEILFYAVFALLIVNLRAGLAAFASWFALCLLFPDAGYFSATINLLFAMGLAAAWAVRRYRIPGPLLLFWGGILVFLAVAVCERIVWQGEKAPPLLYGIGATMSLVGAVALERTHGWRAPRPLTLLGDASYSLYLVHVLIVSATAKAILPLPKEAAFAVIVCSSIAGGFIFHFLFERPTLALLQRRPRGI